MVGLLFEADQLGVPLHGHAPVAELVAHDSFVVVLAQHQDEGKRAHALPDVTDGNACRPPPLRPHVGARAALAEFERAFGDSEL